MNKSLQAMMAIVILALLGCASAGDPYTSSKAPAPSPYASPKQEIKQREIGISEMVIDLKGGNKHALLALNLTVLGGDEEEDVNQLNLKSSFSKQWALQRMQPEFADWLIVFLAGKTPEQFDGSAALETLRSEILAGLQQRARRLPGKLEVQSVLFTRVLVRSHKDDPATQPAR
ncbi:MAG: flagellar basal body-associated FliL family protein [Planctomycetaceae bacterium]|nr:flagellar basal body-associated FliL family protein [Planctomycetaceae bacterium]